MSIGKQRPFKILEQYTSKDESASHDLKPECASLCRSWNSRLNLSSRYYSASFSYLRTRRLIALEREKSPFNKLPIALFCWFRKKHFNQLTTKEVRNLMLNHSRFVSTKGNPRVWIAYFLQPFRP